MKKTIIRLFGVFLFAFIIFKINFSELITVFSRINWHYYGIGLFFLIIWFFVRTIKWKILIRSVGASINNDDLIRIMAKGVFWGIVTPGKLGEFWRAKYLSEKSKISKGRAMYTAIMDRLVDMLVLAVVAILGVIFLYSKFKMQTNWIFYILGFVALIAFLFLSLKKIGTHKISQMTINAFLPDSLKEKTNVFLMDFDKAFGVFNIKIFLVSFVLGMLYYFSAIFVYYFTALALGISIPFWYLFFIVAMVWIILTLPVSFFGLGTREVSFIYFFSLIGVSAPLAVAFSLLALFSNLLLAVPGALLFFKHK